VIDLSQAKKNAAEYVTALPWDTPGDRLTLIDENTIEKPYGWVYFYTSEKWRTTADFRYAVAGNAHFLPKREGGAIHVFGTALPITEYLQRYVKQSPLP
jgi:hypothetical protein